MLIAEAPYYYVIRAALKMDDHDFYCYGKLIRISSCKACRAKQKRDFLARHETEQNERGPPDRSVSCPTA